MDPDDLLKLLDLGGTDAARDPATDLALTSSDAPTPTTPPSPTAFALDAWALRRGQDLHAESDRRRQLGLDAAAAADLHAAAFEPDPELLPTCADPVRHQFLTELLNTPAYHALHATTLLHEAVSALAAAAFAEQLAALRQPPPEGQPAKEPDQAALQAAGQAVAAAEQEVTELHEAAGGLRAGAGRARAAHGRPGGRPALPPRPRQPVAAAHLRAGRALPAAGAGEAAAEDGPRPR